MLDKILDKEILNLNLDQTPPDKFILSFNLVDDGIYVGLDHDIASDFEGEIEDEYVFKYVIQADSGEILKAKCKDIITSVLKNLHEDITNRMKNMEQTIKKIEAVIPSIVH
jgi:hypothetical protein